MSRSSSNASLKSRESSYARLAKSPLLTKGNRLGSKKVDEKGDVSSGAAATKIDSQPWFLHKGQTRIRRQTSDSALTKTNSARAEGSPLSAKESVSGESLSIVDQKKPLPKLLETGDEGQICETLKQDPQLLSLCTSIGLSPHPDTLVGPIEKGQLIIGVLQESLNELIKLKVRTAEKKGKIFHIQQSGLDAAIRALDNAERSLKSIKASKEPVLGRKARSQQSLESLNKSVQNQHLHQKQTEAVIRILSTIKQKFDKMGNGLSNFMTGLNKEWTFLSTKSGTSTIPSSVSSSARPTRRTTGISLFTTPPSGKAGSTRAKSTTSSTSVWNRNENKGKRMASTILL